MGEPDFIDNSRLDDEFPEGKIVERKHKARERNSELIKKAKQNFKEKNGKLFCQICGFDFEKKYGKLGANFIEAHHTIPVSEMNVGYTSKIDEIAIVCSNCHKMLHRKRPWVKMDELEKIIKCNR